MPRIRSLSATAVAILPAIALSPAAGHASVRQPQPASQADPASQAKPASQAWRLAIDRHYGQPGNASGYSEIVTAGRALWAFGGTNPGGQGSPVALIRVGQSWHVSRLPAGLTNFISAASAPDASDIWAISGYGRYALHWDGKRWQVAKRWSGQGALSGVTAISHRDVWVFGTSAAGVHTTGTWHFNGRSWVAVKAAGRDIYRASAVSARDIWAIAAGRRGDSIERLGKQGWRRIHTGRVLAGVRWNDILAESQHNVWILGDDASRLGSGRLVLAHWNGRHWTRIDTSLDAWAGQLASAGPGRLVATATSSGLLADGLIVQMTSQGHLTWSTIASSLGSGVSDVAFAPRTHTLWASGGILTRLGGDAAVWARTLPHADRRADRRADPDDD